MPQMMPLNWMMLFFFFLFFFYMFNSLNYFIFKINPNKNSKNNLFKLNMFNWKW